MSPRALTERSEPFPRSFRIQIDEIYEYRLGKLQDDLDYYHNDDLVGYARSIACLECSDWQFAVGRFLHKLNQDIYRTDRIQIRKGVVQQIISPPHVYNNTTPDPRWEPLTFDLTGYNEGNFNGLIRWYLGHRRTSWRITWEMLHCNRQFNIMRIVR
jgi:hypothetical protein